MTTTTKSTHPYFGVFDVKTMNAVNVSSIFKRYAILRNGLSFKKINNLRI